MDESASPEERLSEEETAEVEAGTGRKVEKRDAKGKIYIGFDNDPTPRAGRQGRMIDDDEERYPSRSEMAGGWAGGEKGLRAFIEVIGFLIQTAHVGKHHCKPSPVFETCASGSNASAQGQWPKHRLPSTFCAAARVDPRDLHVSFTGSSHAFATALLFSINDNTQRRMSTTAWHIIRIIHAIYHSIYLTSQSCIWRRRRIRMEQPQMEGQRASRRLGRHPRGSRAKLSRRPWILEHTLARSLLESSVSPTEPLSSPYSMARTHASLALLTEHTRAMLLSFCLPGVKPGFRAADARAWETPVPDILDAKRVLCVQLALLAALRVGSGECSSLSRRASSSW